MTTQQPLFILTCMRSFSSLISSMLGQHPGLYCLPEVNPFIADTLGASVDILQMVRKRTLDGLYRAVAQLEYGAQTEETVAEARAWVEARRDWGPVAFMAHIATRTAPARLIEKSPSTVLTPARLDTALRLFPDAFFLHLYRHPHMTTASIAKITGHGTGDRRARDPESSWFDTNSAILAAATRIPADRFLSVRGEDVLSNPDRMLTQICDWLGLGVTVGDLAAMRRPEDSPYACMGPASAPFGNDPNFLRDPHYTARPIVLPPLSASLDWAGTSRHLRPQTRDLALLLGYGAALLQKEGSP
jgi:hypothetical protein